jgi:hypothetical protein
MDDRGAERLDPRLRPSLIAGRTEFTYYAGTSRVAENCAPNMKNRSHAITAHVDMPADGGDGVLVAEGGIVGGFTLFVKDRKPVYEYNYFTANRYQVKGSSPLPVGPCTIRMEFEYDGGGLGKGGTVKLLVNGTPVGTGRVEKTEMALFSADETFDIGCDTGSPVSTDYKAPFRFTGKIKKVTLEDIARVQARTKLSAFHLREVVEEPDLIDRQEHFDLLDAIKERDDRESIDRTECAANHPRRPPIVRELRHVVPRNDELSAECLCPDPPGWRSPHPSPPALYV